MLAAPDAELGRTTAPSRPAGAASPQGVSVSDSVLKTTLDREVGPALGADLTLDYFRDLPEHEAASFLLALPGIGPKSANCILSYSLNRPRFAVDTHVEQISGVSAWSRNAALRIPKINHAEFESLVPPSLRKQLHINLIHHGRAVCPRTGLHNAPRVFSCRFALRAASVAQQRQGRLRLRSTSSPVQEAWGPGSRDEGFRIAVAVEQDRNAAQTYRANNPLPVLQADVAWLTGKGLKKLFLESALSTSS